jgi:hypothetical protein
MAGAGRHEISRAKAREFIQGWRKGRKGGVVGGFMDREVLDKILAQPECKGVRYYHAMHPQGHDTIVLVGVDSDGRDLWDGTIAEEAIPCPPDCAPEDA